MQGLHSLVCHEIESTNVESLFAHPGNIPEQKKRRSNEKDHLTISHKQQTTQNKQTTNNNNGELFSFLFIYLFNTTLTIVTLHSIKYEKVRNDFVIVDCWLQTHTQS